MSYLRRNYNRSFSYEKVFCSLCADDCYDRCGQRAEYVDRYQGPALAPAEWYGAQLTVQNEPMLVEFFHTSNRDAKARAAELARLAKKYDGELKVVVVVSQPVEIVEDVVDTTSGYFVAVDTARKIHNAYGVKYVPYSVLVDSKGRLVWIGNSKSLTDKQIEEHIE